MAALSLVAMGLFAASAFAAGSGGSGGGGISGGGGTTTSSSQSPWGTKTLKQGMSGSDVTLLQFYLDVAGVPTNVDGNFGSRTKQSVIAFEQAHGLKANGNVNPTDGRAIGGVVKGVDSIKPSTKAQIHSDGTASAASNAPPVVNALVAAANQIINTSYCYAGGHGSWKSSCYDCSGSVSYALHGAHLLSVAEDSTQLENYGAPGKGRWITIYADSSHTFLVVNGRAFDTANYGGPNRPGGTGPRWRTNATGNLADGGHYIVRHPPGL
jgi:peptidoglycan hydrolase-like protein with peptidoglycan-binding domain